MLCDICNKKQATVHLTEIVDEQMTELHLCEDCAKAKSMEMEQQFGLADLLAGLSDLDKVKQEEKDVITKLKCPQCGLGYDDFRKMGRLGCSECYGHFRKQLAPLLKRIHGANKHYGKLPQGESKFIMTRSELDDLRAQLQKAIQKEEFELAAQLRDKIKDLEKNELEK